MNATSQTPSKNSSIPPLIVEIRPSNFLDGQVGLFAARDLPVGSIIAGDEDFDEVLVPHSIVDSCDRLTRDRISCFCARIPQGCWMPRHLNVNQLSIIWFMNHSCEPNAGFGNGDCYETLKDVASGEELTLDFGTIYSDPFWTLECKCGTPRCRKVITGNDWQRPEFRISNQKRFSRQIKEMIHANSIPKGGGIPK